MSNNPKNIKIGFHISILNGIDKSVDRAIELGCTTYQIFTRNPRSWKFRELRQEEVQLYNKKINNAGISPVYAHLPYIPNISSPNPEIYFKSKQSLKEEVRRCKALEIPYIVIHLGSHLGFNETKARHRILEAINEASENGGPMILIENSSGSGNRLGSRLEEISLLIKKAQPDLGVCFDTCHAYAAGLELRTNNGLLETLMLIDKTFGFEKLKLIHLNDSKGDLFSGIDHHEHIGLGKIGLKGFRLILKSKLAEVPLIMETPIDNRRDNQENMRIVRKLAGLKTHK